MLKRNVCLFFIMLFFWTGTAWADENYIPFSLVTTKDLTFDATIAIEDAQYKLTNDLADRITILNISAERNLFLIKETNDLETSIILLKEYQNREMEILNILNDLDGSSAELVAEIVKERIEKRGTHLLTISENIILNRTARPKFENAINNQEKVNIKHKETLAMAHESAQTKQEQTDKPGVSGTPPGQDSGFIPPGQVDTTPGPPAGTPPGQSGTPPGQVDTTPGPPAGTPPGQSGTPPGQVDTTPRPPTGTPPGQDIIPPGQVDTTPGQGGTPPGQGGTPPGQSGTPPGQKR